MNKASIISLGLSMALLAGVPAAATAQQETINAQRLTAQSIALTASDLGPEWLLSKDASSKGDGADYYDARFDSQGGREVRLTTIVADDVEGVEAGLSAARYDLASIGAVISSVQDNGFGDGRAFKAQFIGDEHMLVAYLFRVHNLVAVVRYVGPTGGADVQSQAVAIARKQEAKLWATLNPPSPPRPAPIVAPASAQPAPTPIPQAAPAPAPATQPQTAPNGATTPAPVTLAPHCAQGEQPRFRLGFATLSDRLGERMGSPTSCEYSDPRGSGDTLQDTDRGLAIYRASTSTTSFVSGDEHWALVGSSVVYWAGDSVDPPATAAALED